MTSTVRVLLGFAVVGASFLSGSFQHVGAQSAGEEGATSEQNLQESAPSPEPAPEEPALQLKLDATGVDVVPSPPRTADGYTLEEMEVRVRRAKIGLGSSAAALFAGGMFTGVGIAESYSACDFFEECAPVPKRYTAYLWTGTALLVGGFAGMVASGILLGRRKFDRDWLRQAHYATPRRAQWDVARSRVVF